MSNCTENLPYDATTGLEGWQAREDARRMEGRSVGEALMFELIDRLRKRHGDQYASVSADLAAACDVLLEQRARIQTYIGTQEGEH